MGLDITGAATKSDHNSLGFVAFVDCDELALNNQNVRRQSASIIESSLRLDVHFAELLHERLGESSLKLLKLSAPRAVPTPQIRAKADELTRNAKTDTEKIQAIYDYVSTRFRYIGISLGIGRYQPHAAEDVLTNDYGDCKDKHTLFAALLAAENIKAYPALLNSTSKIDPEVPSPTQFDHVITALPKDNGYLFLDTTPEVAPFGYLIADLRDKEAPVIPDNGSATLVKTAEGLPFKPFLIFRSTG